MTSRDPVRKWLTKVRFKQWGTVLLLALAATLIACQLQSLAIFPVANAARWYGDETWLMSEAKTQVLTGVVSYPLAVGSTLEHSKGLVLGMPWLSALLYGVPAVIFSGDIVSIGRAVTSVLSIVLAASLFCVARSLGSGRLVAAFAALVLISTRAFFFASHSCRSDILAGLILLLFIWFCERELRSANSRGSRWFFFFGASTAFACVSSSIHLLTLLGPAACFYLYTLPAISSRQKYLGAVSGAGLVVFVLAGIYVLSTGNSSLFSSHGTHVQFQDVIRTIPLLRPFSRSVQTANLLIRYHQFAEEAPQIVIAILAVLSCKLMGKWKREWSSLSKVTIVIVLAWLFLQGAERTYLIHILPLVFLWMTLTLSTIPWGLMRWAIVIASLTIFALGVRDTRVASQSANLLETNDRKAVTTIMAAIDNDWHFTVKPRVVSERTTLEKLANEPRIQTITDHFTTFPRFEQPYDSFFRRNAINYVVLYNSPSYWLDRSVADSFYQAVTRKGKRLRTIESVTGDLGRDYFNFDPFVDTLLLYRLQ